MQGLFLTDADLCGLRSCVRPVVAVHMTAGPDEVRVPGPNQTNELRRPDGLEQADRSTRNNHINRHEKMGPHRLKINSAGIMRFPRGRVL